MIWRAEQILTAIRDNQMLCHCITEERLVKLTGLSDRQVETATQTLRRNGLLEKTAEDCHSLTKAGREAIKSCATVRSGPKGKHTGQRVWPNTTRERAWNAMRIRRKFSVPDLVELIADGSQPKDITNNLRKYVRALCRAGYLTVLPLRERGTAPTSNGHVRYWLQDANDPGPQAPVWRARSAKVYDPNTEKTIDISDPLPAARPGEGADREARK